MIDLLVEISKYVFIIMIGIYTYFCFRVFSKKGEDSKNLLYLKQKIIMFLLHFMMNFIVFIQIDSMELIIFYLAQVVFFAALPALYNVIYPRASKLLLNNMCMLLVIGFVMLSRLSFDRAVRQFEIVVASAVITMFVPYLIKKITFLKDLTYFYAGVGIILLAIVFIIGRVTYGAKLSFEIAGIGIQPSEFVKIIYVFFIASMLCKSKEFYQVVQTSIFAAIHVIILVVSKDLGSALIFFIAYLFMLYIATHKLLYLGAGTLLGCVAAVAAYFMFHHVRVRVLAFTDPFSVIDNEGYQVTQSLFAIGTG